LQIKITGRGHALASGESKLLLAEDQNPESGQSKGQVNIDDCVVLVDNQIIARSFATAIEAVRAKDKLLKASAGDISTADPPVLICARSCGKYSHAPCRALLVLAVILAHHAPLPIAQVGSPQPATGFALTNGLQSLFLFSHVYFRIRYRIDLVVL
jgi:hypothetical protein